MDWLNRCHFGDCLQTMRRMPDAIVHTCVTSPPYFGLRDYGHAGQIGLEETPAAFVAKLVEVFREVRRLLRDDGTLWLNLGDSYAGSWGAQGRSGGNTDGKHSYNKSLSATQIKAHPRRTHHTGSIPLGSGLKPKDLFGIPWRVAFALQEDGWYLRQDIIWHKPNPMPESVLDRCTKAHEYIFLLSKSPSYYCDMGAIAERASGLAEAPRNRWDRADYEVPGQKPQKRASRSGNVERKPRPGVPGDSRHQQGSVPWEGATRNKRSVWTVATTPYKGAHFATFPTELIEPCVLAGAPAGGVVLDPFFGSGTTGQVAQNLGRAFVGCEINPAYESLQAERLRQPSLLLEAA
ncbi:DNA-methyltransferase [Variovorax atrisoli]|uniref:DNA-methyltransferase n=1 Tax=Variovorax atrisoli TaxID=3394203 RepID=UPI00403FF284